MQIASTQNFAQTVARLTSQSQAEHNAELIRVSSGKNYQKRSESCPETARIAELERETKLGTQLAGNLKLGAAWASVSEARVTSVLEVTARIQEIAVRASDTTISETARMALTRELDGLVEDLLSLANSSQDGTALFGGTGGENPVAATRDAEGRIVSVAYAGGADASRSFQAGNTTVEYGVAATGSNGVFADSASGRDLFRSALDLRGQIAAGGAVSAATLAELGQAYDGVTAALVRTGLQDNRLSDLAQQAEAEAVARETRLSGLADTDLAAAAVRLTELETSLQASLSMAAAMGKISLLDYL
ncbi:MAG: flagellin [Lentisphaeria bacterium]|jgi:flagellar hook-associated protein 3 FlgL|nr:flagellin [Lentisphaeria bacterium]